MARVLITGGTGFIGSNLTKRLVQDGHEVTVVSTGSESKIEGVKKILYMGLTGIDFCFVKNQDIVFHLMANNDTLCQDHAEMFLANYYGPQKLFTEAAIGGCENFVYASSTAVYGNSPAPYTEDTPTNPLNPYAESKLEFDRWAMQFAKDRKRTVTGLRYCNVYGPGEDHKGKRMSMIGQLIRQLDHKYSTVKLFEHGEQKRDWVYVEDVVQANILAAYRARAFHTSSWQPAPGEIYNIGSGVASTFNEIVKTIVELDPKRFDALPWREQIEYIPNPIADAFQNHTLCDIKKAGQHFGYRPAFDLKQGIEKYCQSLNRLTSFSSSQQRPSLP